jgi:hypothetical protein
MIGKTGLKDLIAYTETTSRLGDAATFAYEVIAKTTNATLDIAIRPAPRPSALLA